MSSSLSSWNSLRHHIQNISCALKAALARLDKSLDPRRSLQRLWGHRWTFSDGVYLFHAANAIFWLVLMQVPRFPLKLAIPALYVLALLVPLTSQFFLPATPVFSWLLTFYSNRFTPHSWRPSISVSLLPTLESVLYGANISDILTRFTHPILDIIAWLPYGVIHFAFPFVVAAFLFLFRAPPALRLWARTFGYMNLTGVLIQLILPCSPPWYEIIHGLTPANYGMKGSPGGLARIDALFNSQTYTIGFTNSPLVFGAFPSLHSGNATLEALFLSHFFPQSTCYIWAYAAVLYWATMYLTHHYLIDVVCGGCLATTFFYFFLPDEMKGLGAFAPPHNLTLPPHPNGRSRNSSNNNGYNFSNNSSKNNINKYVLYDLEDPRENGRSGLMLSAREFDNIGGGSSEEPSSEDEEVDISYRSPLPTSTPGFPAQQQQQQHLNSLQDASSSSQALTNSHSKKSMGHGGGGGASARGRGHRHTASIASLIRGEERGPEDGWSPVAASFAFGAQQPLQHGAAGRTRTD